MIYHGEGPDRALPGQGVRVDADPLNMPQVRPRCLPGGARESTGLWPLRVFRTEEEIRLANRNPQGWRLVPRTEPPFRGKLRFAMFGHDLELSGLPGDPVPPWPLASLDDQGAID